MEFRLPQNVRSVISMETSWYPKSGFSKTRELNFSSKVSIDGAFLKWFLNRKISDFVLRLDVDMTSSQKISPGYVFVIIGFFVKVICCIFDQTFMRRIDGKNRSASGPLVFQIYSNVVAGKFPRDFHAIPANNKNEISWISW